MSRLPIPGQDNGNWGEILNDFLQQAHNDDGTLKESAISSKEDLSNKSTDITTDATSDDKYPSVKAVKTYTDNKVTQVVDTTSVTGLLKGNGSTIAQANEGVDYLSPVTSPTVDNFASLSATGTIIDSGHKHEDYALSTRGLPAGGTTGQILEKIDNADFSTQWASFAAKILNMVYPVGSIYMSVANTSPASFLGGIWSAWGAGRVPVGVDTTQTEFDTVEETGGENTHALTSSENGPHTHDIRIDGVPTAAIGLFSSGGNLNYTMNGSYTGAAAAIVSELTSGSGASHNNLQPYITCYMWKRIE